MSSSTRSKSMHYLFIQRPGREVEVLGLSSEAVTLGRGSDCTIQLSYQDVSRLHAEIYYEKDQLCLRDRGSKNGTMLNARFIKPHQMFPLHNNDTIKISHVVIWVSDKPTLEDPESGPIQNLFFETILSSSPSSEEERKFVKVLQGVREFDAILDVDHLDRRLKCIVKDLFQAYHATEVSSDKLESAIEISIEDIQKLNSSGKKYFLCQREAQSLNKSKKASLATWQFFQIDALDEVLELRALLWPCGGVHSDLQYWLLL